MQNIRRMFPGGNTAQGFWSFHDNIMPADGRRLYILKGMPGGGKSSLMQAIASKALEGGYSLEYHHCPSDPASIDGLLIKELKLGLVDGIAPHIIDPLYPGLRDKLIDLGAFINEKKLGESRSRIIEAKAKNKIAYSRAFTYFQAAKNIIGLIEKDNQKGRDMAQVNREICALGERVFKQANSQGLGQLRHMFASANTPEGYVDFTQTLLGDMDEIYYIRGEIGTGRSYILESIKELARLKGYSMEVYHHPTIPAKIESLIIWEANIAISSNSKAQAYSHKEINLNKYFDPSVKNEKDYHMYDGLMEEGINNLRLAKANHEILEEAYGPAIDYQGIDRIREDLIREIFNY